MRKCLSGATLKHIAIITMVIDHINKAIIYPRLPSPVPVYLAIMVNLFIIVGRFAFPLFAFLLVEGFFHTRSRLKYLRNLIFFAVLSEIPFQLCFQTQLGPSYTENVFFTLTIAFITMWATEFIRQKTKFWWLAAPFFVIIGSLAATYASCDYQYLGILVVMLFYYLRGHCLIASIAAFIPLSQTPWTLPAFLATNLYSGQRGKQIKWLNYWIYPLHLLVLAFTRFALR